MTLGSAVSNGYPYEGFVIGCGYAYPHMLL